MTSPPAEKQAESVMTDAGTARPLVIWAVSDGRAGNAAPALGLAEAVARLRPAEVVEKAIAWKGRSGRLPWWLMPAPRRLLEDRSAIAPPWPDIWIGTGRATLPLSLRIRRWSRGATFVVQTQDPRVPTRAFDLVVPPRHDRLSGENVFPITGSPHRVTAELLAEARASFADRIDPLPAPRVAVLIGGRSKSFDLTPERAAALAHEIEAAVGAAGGSVMVTFSRRTPEAAQALLAARLRSLPGLIWDGEGPNPYFALLGYADHVLVTEDSANMATEAAATGKPVHILKLEGQSLKFGLLHEDLQSLGASRPFDGRLESWTYAPILETGRAAAEILRRFDARGGPPS